LRPHQNRFILAFILVAHVAFSAHAATYYVDPDLGRDTNNGTSSATAWKTLNKITQFSLAAGDVVRLRRGAAWRERVVFVEVGTAAQPIRVEPYGEGALPVINGADLITAWSAAGANRWSTPRSAEPEFVVFGGEWGTREMDLGGLDSAHEWHWAGGTLTVFAPSAPTEVEVSARRFLIDVFRGAHIHLRDIELKHGIDPVQLTDALSVTVENFVIHDSVGYAGVMLGAISAPNGSGNTVRGCTITRMRGSRESLATGGHGHGVLVWGRDIVAGNTFADNTIHDCGGSGILLLDTSNNTVSGNTVYGLGNPGLVISGLESEDNVIEYNEVYDTCKQENDCFGINLFLSGHRNIIRYNTTHDQHVFTDAEVGIPGFMERSGGIRLDGDTTTGVTDRTGNEVYGNIIYNEYEGIQIYNYSNVTVFNNTIYNSDRAGFYVGSSVAENTANNNVFRNNLVHTSAQWLARHVGANNTTLDNNLYYPDGASALRWENRNVNFAGWQTRSGQDPNGLAVNPQLENPPALDFRLKAGSPAIDAGLAVPPDPDDIVDIPRPQGATVDIGAYEYAAPPEAAFTVTPSTGPRPLAVQFNDTSSPGSSPIIAWQWDFDDDGIIDSTVRNPQHPYTLAGVYTVSLTVTTALGSDTHIHESAVSVWAPPAAAFTATPTLGAAPLAVQFTDISLTGSGSITSWSWDFDGDGVEDSTMQNPLHTFGAGVHGIRLTVTDAHGLTNTLVRAGFITVSAPPTASFIATPVSGAAPLMAQFTDTSVPGTSPITGWQWDFDNNGVVDSTSPNPAHTYLATGAYTVKLTVTTAVGSNTMVAQNFINVGTGPTAAFTALPRTGLAPLTVQFTDASLAGSAPITQWSWDFSGDGVADSTVRNPSHVYGAGQHTVRLTVTDALGESHTRTETGYIRAGVGPAASFTASSTTGLAPLTVTFSDTSAPGSEPITAWAWDLDNDGIIDSNAQHPTHAFPSWGVYTVTLRVTTAFGSDMDVQGNLIQVTARPVADFTASPRNGLAPLAVDFADISAPGSSPIGTWLWNFGDGNTSTAQNPSHLYSASGVYDITLTVTGGDGAADTRTRVGFVNVAEAPRASFTGAPTNGLGPLTVTFTDTSMPGSSPITSWLWNFGDGATSTQRNPEHTYAPGTYTVSLTVTTAAGSDQVSAPSLVTVATPEPPTAGFDADVHEGLLPLTVQFSDASLPGSLPITAWAWSFGDGAASAAPAPQHTYTQPGVYTVSLTVTTEAGEASLVQPAYIRVTAAAGPTASFNVLPAFGPAPLTTQFTDTSSPGDAAITTWTWAFGDGAVSGQRNPVHTYTQSGHYAVSLTVTTPVGSDTVVKQSAVRVFAAVHVDQRNNSGIEDGASWATAYTRIQEGIETAAALGGVEVWVAEGHYDETRPHSDGALVLQPGVGVFGGFDGTETARTHRDSLAHPTIIDGARARGGSAAYHTVIGASNATLDGFTIRGGRATSAGNGRDTGGGMYNNAVSPHVTRCLFTDNQATSAGGGVYTTGGATPVFEACRFEDNSALGAAFAGGMGGAAAIEGGAAARFENCIFVNNEVAAVLFSTGRGGALAGRNGRATVINSTFSGNRALGNFFSPGRGGAMHSEGATSILTNSICWGNTPNEIATDGGGGVTATYSDIAGNYAGTGNRNVNPQFAAAGDFSLGETSPLIDAGTAEGAPFADIRGILRPQGAGIDMGAYEAGSLPVALFTMSSNLGVAPHTVTFSDTSKPGSADITAWTWDFGDGSTSAEMGPSHTYSQPGAYTVRLTVSTGAGSAISEPQTITMAAPVAFLGQPRGSHAYEGESVTFDVQAEGGLGQLTYRWWFDDGDKWQPMESTRGGALTLHDISLSAAGRYWCDVSDDYHVYASAPAELLVAAWPSWTREPVSAEVPAGRTHRFTAEVAGGFHPITATWFKDGEAVPFAKNLVFTLSPVQPEDAGAYTVQAIDAFGAIIESQPAMLTVAEGLPATGGMGMLALAAALIGLGGLSMRRR
jgi:parallel beta-helix repeat protein